MNKPTPTDKQLEYINSIMEFGHYSPPNFKGTTKQEASDYISKYKHCLVSDFAIEHGYD